MTVRGVCAWCGTRFVRECESHRVASKVSCCSNECNTLWQTSRNTIRDTSLRTLTRPREQKRRVDAYLTRQQIHAAYKLYEAGWSINRIAESGWQRWGYASVDTARGGLRRAFALDGLPRRSKRDALRLAAGENKPCVGCGCELDAWTTGCPTCQKRHWYRRKQNAPARIGEGIKEAA